MIEWLGLQSIVIYLLACTCTATFNWRRYDGYKVLRIDIKDNFPVDELRQLERYPNEYDFWSHGTGIEGPVDIMVSPKAMSNLQGFLTKHHTNYTTIIDDVQGLIEEQNVEPRNRASDEMNWKEYHRLETINDFSYEMAQTHPDIVKVVSIGNTNDGRDLLVTKIGTGSPAGMSKKPGIWLDGGFHAREWISPAVVTYIMHKLVKEYDSNETIHEMVNNVDWYMLPVANPDGYEYSHERDRLWRRSRSRTWLFCRGVDLNRNFPYHWLEFGMGGNIIPCTQNYAGPYPGSEPEVQAITKYILSINDTLKVYLSFHSYGQLWLTPWAYVWGWPTDYEQLHSLAKTATDAIRKRYYTRYRVGPTSFVLYLASGTSQDWARGVAGIKYSYTVELRDRGLFGFLLPPWDIEPTCKETWDGMVAMYLELKNRNFH